MAAGSAGFAVPVFAFFAALDGYAKVGVLAGSVLSALAAAVLLRCRNRHYRTSAAEEAVDADQDGVPDVCQSEISRS